MMARYTRQVPRLELGRVDTIVSLCLFTVILAACSSELAPPGDLLLGPDDFPSQGVTETSWETGETNLGEPAVQVELTGPDFTLLQNLVLFETANLARSILVEIKQDQISQGVTAQPADGFEDNSGVLEDRLNGEDASTLFFVQERALVRITLTGAERMDRVWAIARSAREKSGNQ